MTLQEFAEWEAFDRIEPIGQRGVETILALLSTIVAKACGVTATPEDFTPWRTAPKPVKVATTAEIKAELQRALGGR